MVKFLQKNECTKSITIELSRDGLQLILMFFFFLFFLQYELGVVPIPKAEDKGHIEQNFDIFDFQLKEEDKQFLKDFDRNYRTLNIAFWKASPYYPYWKYYLLVH